MKKKTKTQLCNKADRLFSNYWREKIGRCEKCGSKDNLQLSHIITRSIRKLRFDRRNTQVICASCHRHFHNKPLEFSDFVRKDKGEQVYKDLIRESNKLTPIGIKYYEDIIEQLQSEMEKE